jgi:hypothetical protein
MPVSLLDVNVRLALAWPNHVHREAAHYAFAAIQAEGWDTCPHTELGFVRLSIQPAVVEDRYLFWRRVSGIDCQRVASPSPTGGCDAAGSGNQPAIDLIPA